jgi:tetratricopeptide (TPR) repeat protein
MLNRALRLIDGDIIIRMGFFIRDLHQHIEELHAEQFGDQYSPASFTVYRGQGLSKTDFEQMLNTKGGLISFNNFLSTSKQREISLGFAQYAAANPDSVGILFIMQIDPAQSTAPFASIREISYFHTEDEVLFSMNTVFRICDIKPMTENNCLYEAILTLTSDDDEDLCALTDSIRDEIPSCEGGWRPLGLMLEKMGQFDKAEEVYQALLEQITYELTKGSLYHVLGRIKFSQGKYQEAIMFHDKAINIYQENFSPVSPKLFDIYNNIGLAYGAIGENSTALSYFEKAVAIRQQSHCSDHPDLAYSYNNIGNVYYSMDNYLEALSFHEKALAIQQQSLPPNHPHLAVL